MRCVICKKPWTAGGFRQGNNGEPARTCNDCILKYHQSGKQLIRAKRNQKILSDLRRQLRKNL